MNARYSMIKRASEVARAAVAAGAVTRERLQAAAAGGGKAASPLVRSLLAQSVPTIADLARAYDAAGGSVRIDPSFLSLSPRACRLLDPEMLRRVRAIPVEILDDLCILAVESGHAAEAVTAVRHALDRPVLPVLADAAAIERILDDVHLPPKAVTLGPIPRRDSPVHARFRELVVEDAILDALPGAEGAHA